MQALTPCVNLLLSGNYNYISNSQMPDCGWFLPCRGCRRRTAYQIVNRAHVTVPACRSCAEQAFKEHVDVCALNLPSVNSQGCVDTEFMNDIQRIALAVMAQHSGHGARLSTSGMGKPPLPPMHQAHLQPVPATCGMHSATAPAAHVATLPYPIPTSSGLPSSACDLSQPSSVTVVSASDTTYQPQTQPQSVHQPHEEEPVEQQHGAVDCEMMQQDTTGEDSEVAGEDDEEEDVEDDCPLPGQQHSPPRCMQQQDSACETTLTMASLAASQQLLQRQLALLAPGTQARAACEAQLSQLAALLQQHSCEEQQRQQQQALRILQAQLQHAAREQQGCEEEGCWAGPLRVGSTSSSMSSLGMFPMAQ